MFCLNSENQSVYSSIRKVKKKKKTLIIIVSTVSLLIVILVLSISLYFTFKGNSNIIFPDEVMQDERVLFSKDNKPLEYKDIMEAVTEYAKDNSIDIIGGSYFCTDPRCSSPDGKFIYKWKLECISEILTGEFAIDIKDEIQGIREYDESLTKHKINTKDKEQYKGTLKNFRINRIRVMKHNKNPKRKYDMELNHFALMPGDPLDGPTVAEEVVDENEKILSEGDDYKGQIFHMDWREKLYVGDVFKQGPCASTWAIAAIDMFNPFLSIRNRDMMFFSLQQIVDCASESNTCEKGEVIDALEYLKKSKVCLEQEYPYVGEKGKCSDEKCKIYSEINEIVSLENVILLDHLISHGPFVVNIYINSNFKLYKGGVFNAPCDGKEKHPLVVVGHGYDIEKKANYWTAKNYWGEGWGEYGYIRLLDTITTVDGKEKRHCDIDKNAHGLKWVYNEDLYN